MTNTVDMVFWTRKVNRIQDTLYVCIPKEYANTMKLSKGDTMRITVGPDGSLIIHAKENMS